MNNTTLSYIDFVSFVLRSLSNYRRRYHNWTDDQERVLSCVIGEIKCYSQEVSDIQSLIEYMDISFGIYVPFAWGTYSEPDFHNWYNLYTNYEF